MRVEPITGADTGHVTEIFRQDGRIAIVTGASSGIGARMASTLARAGARVYAAARRRDRLDALAAQVPGIVAWEGDLAEESTCRRLVSDVVEREGRVDVLVNNAGVSNIERAEHEPVETFRSVLDLNLVTTFTLASAAGAQMLTQDGGGSIVNVASIVGLVGIGRMPQAGYAASKGGVVMLTRELAAQWARKGVRVNAIAPGWFPTELTEELFQSERGSDWVSRLTPMGRGGTLDELDGALLLLAGAAGSYMTGVVLPVDGGWTAV